MVVISERSLKIYRLFLLRTTMERIEGQWSFRRMLETGREIGARVSSELGEKKQTYKSAKYS